MRRTADHNDGLIAVSRALIATFISSRNPKNCFSFRLEHYLTFSRKNSKLFIRAIQKKKRDPSIHPRAIYTQITNRDNPSHKPTTTMRLALFLTAQRGLSPRASILRIS